MVILQEFQSELRPAQFCSQKTADFACCYAESRKVLWLFYLFLHVSRSQLFSPIWILIVQMHWIWETSRNKLKNNYVSKIIRTFHGLNKLFHWSQNFCKLLAFSFKFQKIFSITRFFSHRRSEQFWKQNTRPSWFFFPRLQAS